MAGAALEPGLGRCGGGGDGDGDGAAAHPLRGARRHEAPEPRRRVDLRARAREEGGREGGVWGGTQRASLFLFLLCAAVAR